MSQTPLIPFNVAACQVWPGQFSHLSPTLRSTVQNATAEWIKLKYGLPLGETYVAPSSSRATSSNQVVPAVPVRDLAEYKSWLLEKASVLIKTPVVGEADVEKLFDSPTNAGPSIETSALPRFKKRTTTATPNPDGDEVEKHSSERKQHEELQNLMNKISEQQQQILTALQAAGVENKKEKEELLERINELERKLENDIQRSHQSIMLRLDAHKSPRGPPSQRGTFFRRGSLSSRGRGRTIPRSRSRSRSRSLSPIRDSRSRSRSSSRPRRLSSRSRSPGRRRF